MLNSHNPQVRLIQTSSPRSQKIEEATLLMPSYWFMWANEVALSNATLSNSQIYKYQRRVFCMPLNLCISQCKLCQVKASPSWSITIHLLHLFLLSSQSPIIPMKVVSRNPPLSHSPCWDQLRIPCSFNLRKYSACCCSWGEISE